MKNIIEISKKVEENNSFPSRYCIMLGDVLKLAEIVKNDPNSLYEVLATAFRYGFYQGNHCTINRKLKKL